MRRKLRNLKNKSGHSANGAPRTVHELTVYREHRNNVVVHLNNGTSPHWDPQYAGWSSPSRPRDHAIFLRHVTGRND
jgi:hypothetical protein